jgi:hypothetical protein
LRTTIIPTPAAVSPGGVFVVFVVIVIAVLISPL